MLNCINLKHGGNKLVIYKEILIQMVNNWAMCH